MIKAKNNVTVVVLALASNPSVLTFVQHPNGGLSQGDDSSATEVLEFVKDGLLRNLKESKKVLDPVTQIEKLIQQFPMLEQTMPADLRAKLKGANSSVDKLTAVQKNIDADLQDVDKLLHFARLYDTGQAAPTTNAERAEEDFMSLLDRLFGDAPGTTYQELPDDFVDGDVITGCGREGCSGCNGRKVFEYKEGGGAGNGMFSLGNIKAPAKEAPSPFDGMPEDLKALLSGGNFKVIKIGGQRGTDPLQGLAEVLTKAFGNTATKH